MTSGERLYRLALRLYPRGFRELFADELVEILRLRLLESPRIVRPAHWLGALASAVRHGPAERWAERRGRNLPEPLPPRAPRGPSRSAWERAQATAASTLRDARMAWRALLRRPLVGLAMVTTLALGLGANAFLFGVVEAVVLRPFPYQEMDRLVLIDNRYGDDVTSSSPPDFLDRRDLADTLDRAAAYRELDMALLPVGGSQAQPRQVRAAQVTGGFFGVLGVTPRLGQARFPAAEDAPSRQVVLSEGLWRSAFGGDPAVIGRAVLLDGEAHEVTAVLPAAIDYPRRTELWLPLTFTPDQLADSYRSNEFLSTLGRLAPGVRLEQAAAEMDALAQRTLDLQPSRADFLRRNGFGAHVELLEHSLVGRVRPALFLFSLAVGAVLLLACANVAHLLLAQASARRREMAVRRALGAGRLRLTRQVLTECLLLSFVGAGLGVSAAAFALRRLELFVPGDVPRLEQAALDGPLLGFALAAAMVSAVLFGLPAALRHTGVEQLRSTSALAGRSGWVRRVLVVTEVALALLLVAGAGVLARSFHAMTSVEVGFEAEGRSAVRLLLPNGQSPEQILAFQQRLLDEISALPGVEAAAVADHLPLSGGRWTATFRPEGHGPDVSPGADIKIVGPGFFETLEVPLLAGRSFADRDLPDGQRVVVVDEWTARRYFVAEDGALTQALGRRVNVGDLENPRYREIVGVVGHVRTRAFDEEGLPQLYFSATQIPLQSFDVVIHRTLEDDGLLARQIQTLVGRLDPTLPTGEVAAMDQVVDHLVALERFQARVLLLLALLALFLASVGLYGVLAFTVARRTREFGLRIALGASRRRIALSVLAESLALTVAGLAIGCGLATVAIRWLRSLAWNVDAADLRSWAAAAGVLLVVSIVAATLPALRATRVSPGEALRAE